MLMVILLVERRFSRGAPINGALASTSGSSLAVPESATPQDPRGALARYRSTGRDKVAAVRQRNRYAMTPSLQNRAGRVVRDANLGEYPSGFMMDQC
jgi:hypothetical protein